MQLPELREKQGILLNHPRLREGQVTLLHFQRPMIALLMGRRMARARSLTTTRATKTKTKATATTARRRAATRQAMLKRKIFLNHPQLREMQLRARAPQLLQLLTM